MDFPNCIISIYPKALADSKRFWHILWAQRLQRMLSVLRSSCGGASWSRCGKEAFRTPRKPPAASIDNALPPRYSRPMTDELRGYIRRANLALGVTSPERQKEALQQLTDALDRAGFIPSGWIEPPNCK